MRYWVTYKIDARYVAAVDAENIHDALQKAQDEYIDEDFGAAQDINGTPIIIQDECDNFVWEA